MIVLFRAVVRVRVLQARAQVCLWAARGALAVYVHTSAGPAWLARSRSWLQRGTALAVAADQAIPR